MISLRDFLTQQSEPAQDRARLRLAAFMSWPGSLRRAVRSASNPPDPGAWSQVFEAEYDGVPGGGSANAVQGFTSDGETWFVPVTDDDNKWPWVYRLDSAFKHLLGRFNVRANFGADCHVGDCDFHDGRLYLPIEADTGPHVMEVTPDLSQMISLTPLLGETGAAPPSQSNPWCAINPWNKLLYSSAFDNADTAFAFDPRNAFRHRRDSDIRFSGADVDGAQGGKFDGNGHLIMTSRAYKDIRVFSALNGRFLGNCEVDEKEWDELEGLCIWPRVKDDGTPVQVFVSSVITKVTGVLGGGVGHLYRKGFQVPDFSTME